MNQFWTLNLWKNEYMLGLRERIQRKSHQLRAHPQIGEVVLVKDNLLGSRWKVDKIVELVVGKDKNKIS